MGTEFSQPVEEFEFEVFENCFPCRKPTTEEQDKIKKKILNLGLAAGDRNRLGEAVEAWRKEQKKFEGAKKEAAIVEHYKRGELDHDADYKTDDGKDLTVDQYVTAKQQLRTAVATYRETTQVLLSWCQRLKIYEHDSRYLEDFILYDLLILDSELDALLEPKALKRLRRTWPWEVEQRKSRAFAFRDPGLSGWVGYWQLGAGGFGQADLWVKCDDELKIRDRVVVKDSRFTGSDLWDDPDLWVRNLNSVVPTEVQALYNLRGLIGSNNIVKIHNFKINRKEKLHRILMEFCPFGDPHTIIRQGHIYGEQPRFESNKGTDNSAHCEFIAEPFLWYMFESMVKVGLLMERGELEPHGVKDWDIMIHRDLKLDNVFLGNKSTELYPGYPEPKVGDFGTCLLKPTKDPNQILIRGTEGIRAPEQWRMSDETGNVMRMDGRTNVWGVGITLYSLLACENGLQEQLLGKDDAGGPGRDDFTPPELDASGRAHYSEELVQLVMSCLRYNPGERPTFDELLKQIVKYTDGTGPRDLSHGMRHAIQPDPQYDVKFRTTADKWAIGSAVAQAGDAHGGNLPTTGPFGNATNEEQELMEKPGGGLPRHDGGIKRPQLDQAGDDDPDDDEGNDGSQPKKPRPGTQTTTDQATAAGTQAPDATDTDAIVPGTAAPVATNPGTTAPVAVPPVPGPPVPGPPVAVPPVAGPAVAGPPGTAVPVAGPPVGGAPAAAQHNAIGRCEYRMPHRGRQRCKGRGRRSQDHNNEFRCHHHRG